MCQAYFYLVILNPWLLDAMMVKSVYGNYYLIVFNWYARSRLVVKRDSSNVPFIVAVAVVAVAIALLRISLEQTCVYSTHTHMV